MHSNLKIRRYLPGEEPALYAVHYSAIHLVARRDYSAEQIWAWAPYGVDMQQWARRIRDINPFVAELSGELVGYADLQGRGYIEHFFVSGKHPGQGIGTRLMQHLLQEARARGIAELRSDVSRTAQPLFERFGFTVVELRSPTRRGVVIPNALMCCSLHLEAAVEIHAGALHRCTGGAAE
ncbi:MAG: GNAT family N-acetyltransferase [Burkholderiaceae bacterium]|jgi:putative acetyltransferase|nr:GNAT family N-acetyltransferase [Burkholderiaceae bacterium]